MPKQIIIVSVMLVILGGGLVNAQEEARLLRYPTVYENQLVFTYAGDLYTTSINGGVARKLTNHVGYERLARFSPDGSMIAFSGEYDGNDEVYVMPSTGGVPKRLTYTGVWSGNLVLGWRDNQHVLFRSSIEVYKSSRSRLYLADVAGGLPQSLPFSRGGFASFSPDKRLLAYNRIMLEYHTWKRYRGGQVDDIWVYDFEADKTINITNNNAHDAIPMWHQDKIYFLSDDNPRQRMNLYVYDFERDEIRQLTAYEEFDIKFPSMGQNAIVYEYGGYIYYFDLATEQSRKIPIFIREDRIGARQTLVNVSDQIVNDDISPDGKRAVICARGDIFTVPAEHGVIRNLTKSSGVHDRDPHWSPDGKWIAYISDASGEDEIYIIAQNGSGKPQQITNGDKSYKHYVVWSPDSKKILWSDRDFKLKYVDIETKRVVQVDQSNVWDFWHFSWSPDSRWIAYVKAERESMSQIYLYSLENQTSYPVTEGWYEARAPIFDPDGQYLYFVSDQAFDPIYSRTEWNHAYQDISQIGLITLRKDVPSPFEPKSDEVEIKEDEENEDDKDDSEADSTKTKDDHVKIDLDGINERIIMLPIEAAYYWDLSPVKDKIYYIKFKYVSDDRQSKMMVFDLKKQEETFIGMVNDIDLSANREKMLISRNGSVYTIVDPPKKNIDWEKPLDLSGMEVMVDRQAEWNQIFYEAWRVMREYFYDPNMHGVPWEGIRNKYAPLVEHVNHRSDLTYVLAEMIGELNTSHTYVGGGDYPDQEMVQVGLLGAEIKRDDSSGYYYIETILDGQNWNNWLRSPLREVGVDVNEGDYIIAINGQSTKDVPNIYQLLVNKLDTQVTLTVNNEPTMENSHEVVVIPTRSETGLYYYNWVEDNIRYVTEKTDGKVGYIHIPNMGWWGLQEFAKYFYPQLDKKALIVDIRGNSGGNISSMLIERLKREVDLIRIRRGSIPQPSPADLVNGPKVCLIDELTASDGDLFAYRFRKNNLGKLIGKRTWGGVVGIFGATRLIDGGYLTKPENATYSIDGEWVIEGYGVDPDIEVDNDPAREYRGIDDQLDKAIEVILEELKTDTRELPPIPPFPNKWNE